MTKSTFFLVGTCMVLTAAVTVVAMRLVSYQPERHLPQVGGASVKIGLPVQDANAEKLFDVSSALLFDTASDRILFEQNGFEQRPLASITKLMTAMVALDHGIAWSQEADIQLEEYVQGGQLLLHPGETVTMKDLFYASVLGSANNATLAYVRQLGIPKEEFIQEMNRKAISLGLEQTEFYDVTGLDTRNVSTAYDIAVLAKTAFKNYALIAQATSPKEYTFFMKGSGREHTIRNTNKLISEHNQSATGSKTGYLYEAGYCLVMQGDGETASRIGVVLNSPSEQGHFADMDRLLHLHVQ